MSAVILSPAFPIRTSSARAAEHDSVRFTRRGKAVLVFGFLAVAMVLMVVFGGFAAATREAPDPVRVVQVQSGDTLYDIAGEVAAPGEVRSVMHHIKVLNDLDSTTLEIGQRLAVPRA